MAQGRAKGSPKTGGRRPGSPNKVTKALKEMILGALDQAGGQDYLAVQAVANPAAFMALLGRVLPTTLGGDPAHPIKHIFEWAKPSKPSES
jgi:hypothetical protein